MPLPTIFDLQCVLSKDELDLWVLINVDRFAYQCFYSKMLISEVSSVSSLLWMSLYSTKYQVVLP